MAAEVPRAIAQGNMKKAHTMMGKYLDIFGPERYFIEVQEHSIPELSDINKVLIKDMQPRYNLRFLATNDVHYTAPEEAAPHDVLLCIQTGSLVSDEKRLKFSDDGYYLKSYEEMAALFGHIPGALDNSLLIAEMCDVDLDTQGYHLPLFDVPEGDDAESYLRRPVRRGSDLALWRGARGHRPGRARPAGARAAHHQPHGLRHLLPHRLGPVRICPRRPTSGGTCAGRARARSWPIRWASRASTRWPTA